MLCAAPLSLPLKNKIQHNPKVGFVAFFGGITAQSTEGLRNVWTLGHYFVYVGLWVCI